MKKKRFLASFLCALLIVAMMPTGVFAASSLAVAKVGNLKQNTVTTKSINISWKAQPNVSGYMVYRSEAYDGTYTCIKKICAGNTAFCNQKLSAGKEYYYKVCAYVQKGSKTVTGQYSNILTASTKATSSPKATARVNTNVRKHAGTNFDRITTIKAGSSVNIVSSTLDKSGTKWYKVSFSSNGKTTKGYLRADLVNTVSNGGNNTPVSAKKGKVISRSNLNVRTDASLNARVITSLPNGTVVTILSSKTGSNRKWYYVSFKKNNTTLKGYVAADYVRIV